MMASHYAQYILERENFQIIEDERGFATYFIKGEECYIRDIYIAPEFRLKGAGTEFCNEIEKIAKAAGCTYMTGTVVPTMRGSTESIQACIKAGFKLLFSTPEKIILKKEL